MEEDFYFTELFEIYEGLLTENQRNAFYAHYCLDLSLAEIAESSGTGRQSVYETIKTVKTKLSEYENALKLRTKFARLKALANGAADKKLAEEILSAIGE